MATDSVLGLFADPFQILQQQSAATDKRASDFAQMTPMQQAQYGIYGGASRLAGGLAQALGAEDPMLQRQSARRALVQQVDASNPESLVRAVQLSANDPELQAYFMKQYKELTGIQKEQSVIQKNQAWEASKTDYKERTNLVAQVEQDLAENKEVSPVTLNKAKLAFGFITRPQYDRQPDGSLAIVPPTVDASMFPNLGKYMSKTTGGSSATQGVNTNNGLPAVTGVIETPLSLETKRKQLTGLEEGKAQLTSLLGKIDDTEKLIGPMSTGWGQKFLGSMPGSEAMTLNDNTQVIKANLALTKLQELKNASKTGASGLGTVSDRDMATIKETIAGLNPLSANYKKDLQTIREFFTRAQKAMDKEVEILSSNKQESQQRKQSPMSGKNPQLQPTEEAWIERAMARNPTYSRAQIIEQGIKNNKLPAGYQ